MPSIESMESLLLTLWRMSWQAAILVLLVLLAHGLMRHRLSPAWRSALWFLVVARLLLPITPSSPWSLFHLTDRVATRVNSTPGTTTAFIAPSTGVEPPPDWAEPLDDQAWLPPLSMWESRPQPPPLLSPPAWTVPALEPILSPTPSPTRRAVPWTPILFWTWLTGVVLLGARLGWGAAAFHRGIRRLPPVRDPRVLTLLDECRAIMGTRVLITLIETDAVDSPALFGFLRLRLLLPTGGVRRLSNADLRHLFLHELAHVRRGDVPLNWLTSALQIVHWFNPVVWLAFARMRADRELACDAMALDRNGAVDRAAYGATVLKLVSGLKSTRPAPGLVGISEGKSNLRRRIRMIASHRPSRRWSVWAALILLTLGLVSLTDARDTVEIREQEEVPASEVGSELPFFDLPRDAEAADAVAGARGNADQAAWHVHIGRLLYEMGRFPEAEAALRRAYQFDPENEVAHHYRKLISERRRQAVREQLRKIILSEVRFDGLPLGEVLDFLNREAIRHDPERRGVPMILFHHMISGDTGPAVSDPTMDPDLRQTPHGEFDLDKVLIRIVPPIRNVRLPDVLDAVVRNASQSIRYSIEDFGVVFAPAEDASSTVLETRVYRVNPDRWRETMRWLGAQDAGSGQLPAATQTAMRELARVLGINLQPPNQIFYNDRKGILMVRATPAEQDRFQVIVEVLAAAPQQITIEHMVVESDLDGPDHPGLDWGSARLGSVQVLDPVVPSEPQDPAPYRTLAGLRLFFDGKPGVRALAGPRITTLSGRQTLINLGLPGDVSFELDCLPVVQPNGQDIGLAMRIRAGHAEEDASATTPELREFVTSGIVPLGRSVLLTFLDDGEIPAGGDPVFGALPPGVRDARVDAPVPRGRRLLLLVTPTMTDPAGNPVHVIEQPSPGPDGVLALDRTNEEASRLKLEGFIKPEPQLPRGGSAAESGSQDEARREQIQTYVRNGRALYEMGKLTEAEAELRRALGLDPENGAARYYLNLISQAQREAARRKLPDILFREVMFDGVPLPDVLESLQATIRPAGPDFRFRIQPLEDRVALAPPADFATGEETPSTPIEPIDLNKVAIRFDAPYRNVRLSDLLEAIVRSADKPIRYFIDESGVVFTQAPPRESHRPETRLFRVNIARFLENEEQARELLASAGVNLQPPHHLHLNTRTGILIVRAKGDDLRVVQHVLGAIGASVTAPLLALDWRIVEMNRADAKRLGLDWFSGPRMLSRLHDPVPPATTPATNQFSGILTADQFDQIQHALERDPAVRLTSSPTIKTLSGYHTQLAHSLPDNTRVDLDCLPLVQRHGFGIELSVRVRVRAADAKGSSSVQAEPSSQDAHAVPGYIVDAAIWDGQTVLLGGPFPASTDDPVSQGTADAERILLVLLTPTINDAAGNRVHSSDSLPFDPNTVPSQETDVDPTAQLRGDRRRSMEADERVDSNHPAPSAQDEVRETRIFRVDPENFIEQLRGVGSDFLDARSSPTGDIDTGLGIDLPAALSPRPHAVDRFGRPSDYFFRSDTPSPGESGLVEFDIPRAFIPGIGPIGPYRDLPGVTSTNVPHEGRDLITRFFLAADINVLPPNRIYFKERTGVLMVHATPRELDAIQRAIEVLSSPEFSPNP